MAIFAILKIAKGRIATNFSEKRKKLSVFIIQMIFLNTNDIPLNPISFIVNNIKRCFFKVWRHHRSI